MRWLSKPSCRMPKPAPERERVAAIFRAVYAGFTFRRRMPFKQVWIDNAACLTGPRYCLTTPANCFGPAAPFPRPRAGVQILCLPLTYQRLTMATPMQASVNALLLLLAQATDKALARYVQFLKVENQILRSKLPHAVKVTPQERRRLVKFGRPRGLALKELISIVSPRIFLRWLDANSRLPTVEAIRDLVIRLAGENDSGSAHPRRVKYTRRAQDQPLHKGYPLIRAGLFSLVCLLLPGYHSG